MMLIPLAVAAVLVGIDQAIKYWAVQSLAAQGTIPLIQDVLHFTYVENTGAAFSILQDKTWLLIGLTSLIAAAALVVLLSGKLKDRFLIWTVTLILAGGLGNLIDRIFRGFVVDYIDFRLINFAVFNFADCCVVIGTVLLAVYILFFDSKKEKEKPDEQLLADESRSEGEETEES